MGVPGLFGSLIRAYANHNIIKKTIDTSLPTHLYLDFNCAIYTAFNANSSIKTEESLIIYTIQYLETLCRFIPNLELIYIALDGAPPFAKCIQQRQRRFHSICKKNRANKINESFGSELDKSAVNNDIDLNMITPGTRFMQKLSVAIKHALKTGGQGGIFLGKKLVFSDASIEGEGEHKIIGHIREGLHLAIDGTFEDKALYGKEHNTVIYGLDGDLIFLSLTLNISNLYLYREAADYGHLATDYEGHKYLFLDIDSLSLAIIDSFRVYYPNLNNDQFSRYIDDYIFIGMLLGNDFMPKCYWFSIQSGGYEKLLSCYFQVHNHTEAFLVDTAAMQINTEMLADILFLVMKQEDEAATTLCEKRKRFRIRITEDMSERERQQMLSDCYPLQHLYVEAPIEPKKPGWRQRYYKICLNMDSSPANLEMVSQAYLKTLVWNFNYYFNGCIAWDWYYPFPYSPTITDIYNELIKHKNINCTSSNKAFHFKPSGPLDQQTLLLCVLPFASRGFMVRDAAAKIVDSKCDMKIYFPKRYGLNVAFHSKYYECTPIIPNIDIEKAKKFMKECKFSDDELARNIRGELFMQKL